MIKKVTEDDFTLTRWSGGVTKELFIYPENSSYKNRDFNFRISMATAEIETSTFTSLPGIHRFISILKGNIELSHKGKKSVNLIPHEIHYFEGDWETTAKGKVLDFNLMLKNSTGTLEYKELRDKIDIKNPDITFIFSLDGDVAIGNTTLKKNELAVAKGENISIEGKNVKIYIGKIFNIK